MAEKIPNKHDTHQDPEAMHDLDQATLTTPGDIIRQVNYLKAKNLSKHDESRTTHADVNKHLAECINHYLQVTSYRLVFSAGSPLILARPDGSINHFNSEKISLAMKLLEFDRKRAISLRAFYDAQREFFSLIKEMKETEVGIQQLLGSIAKDGDEDHPELQESKGRIALLEQTRTQMRETWLELLEELS